jgi:hypothetical protein
MLRTVATALVFVALATIGPPYARAGGPTITSPEPSPPLVTAPAAPPDSTATEPPKNAQTTYKGCTPAANLPCASDQGSSDSLDQKDLENQVVGAVVAFLVALLAWYLIAIYFTPHLEISPLTRSPVQIGASSRAFRHRVKLRNASRLYAVADLSLQARLVVKGLDPQRPDLYSSTPIEIGEGVPFPTLDRRSRRAIVEDFERTYVVSIPDNLGALDPYLPADVRQRVRNGEAGLDELLQLGKDAFVRLAVSCSHARSGYRRTYSTKFKIADIQEGQFKPNSVAVTAI